MHFRCTVAIAAAAFLSLPTLSAQALSGQSMPTYWRLADPDAKMLAGIDLKALLNSPAAADWKAQFQKATNGALPAQLQGFDEGGVLSGLFQKIDRVFISLGEIPQGTSSKPKMTVALVGDFDLAALRAFMGKQGGVKSVYRGVEVWQSGKAADNVMIALASPQVLALGDKVSVRKAVTQFAIGGTSAMGSPIYKRAAALAAANDIWMAGEVPETPTGAGAAMPMALAKSIHSFDFGLRMRAGLDFELNLFAGDADSAKGLSTALQAMIQLAASDKKNPQVSDFLQRVQMGTEGEQLQLKASWTQAELVDMARMQSRSLAALAPGTLPGGPLPGGTLTAARVNGATAPAPVIPAKPREPLKVRIYNPDGGVKEVELKRD